MSILKPICVFLFILLGNISSFAQKSYTIKASELNKYSFTLLGDSLLWPLLVSISERNYERNEYVIASAKSSAISEYRKHNELVVRAQSKLQKLIKNGAKVFAEKELEESEAAQRLVTESILSGNGNAFGKNSKIFFDSVDHTEKVLNTNRQTDISATLTEKNGDVKKRSGLLGKWNETFTGDLYKESDGLRTGKESLAKLSFIDGSDIVIESNTTAIVRQTKVDRLDNTVRSDITLVNGSLLTRLSNSAKSEDGYTLRSGDAVSTIRSSKFWASSNSDNVVKLSNYDGDVKVSNDNATISIKRNQGTIVVKGKKPLPPIDLLPSPKLNWSRLDTSFYREDILLKWSEIPNKKNYEIEISTVNTFDHDVRKYVTPANELTLKSIKEGISYIRIVAIDRLGLRGTESQVYRLIRNKDSQPPALFIDGYDGNIIYHSSKNIQISGMTEPDAKLELNSIAVKLSQDGVFRIEIPAKENLTNHILKVTDRAGNSFVRTVQTYLVTPELVSQFQVNGSVTDSQINIPSSNLTISGKSIPNVVITILHNGKVYDIRTGFQGEWGISLEPNKSQPILFKFRLGNESSIFYQKSYLFQK